MWFLEQFKVWCNSNKGRLFGESNGHKDVWEEYFKPQLESIIKLSLLSSWDKIEWRNNSVGLYGYDVMIDKDCKMWLLEVNKCPTMEHSTKITSKLVPTMMEDMLKVILDWKKD